MRQRFAAWIRRAGPWGLGLVIALPVTGQSPPQWRHVQGGKYGGALFLDANRGWLAADAHIKYTVDGGENWEEVVFQNAETDLDIRVDFRGMFIVEDPFSFEITGWAVGDGGVVVKTAPNTTNGQTWVDFNDPTNLSEPGSRVLNTCELPAVLYDIFMFPPAYDNGWCVGEDGAIAVTTDGGLTWDNVADNVDGAEFFCDPNDPGDPDDAYIVHFFTNDPMKGVIAGEYRKVYTTMDGGGSWFKTDVTLDDPANPAYPTITYIHDSPINNLEWWGLDFDDPADPASGAYIVGGIGNQMGYMYRTPGLWTGPWTQVKDYDFLVPSNVMPQFCAPTTQYDTVVLEPAVTMPPMAPARGLSVGYGSQLFDFTAGEKNYDPSLCAEINPAIPLDHLWKEQPRPPLSGGVGEPLFRAIAKRSSTQAVAAGGFGRIVKYDNDPLEPIIKDVGTRIPRRLNDGAFLDASTAIVFGQHLDVHYTENAGVDWTSANTDAAWKHDGGHQGHAIAFDSTGTHGIAVGDQLGPPSFDPPYLGKGFLGRTVGTVDAYTDWVIVDPEASVFPSGTASPGTLNGVTFAPGFMSTPPPSGFVIDTAWVVGDGGWVSKSEDWGASWQKVEIPTSARLNAVSFATPTLGYVVGNLPVAFITYDAGISWEEKAIGTGEEILDIETWGDGSNAVAVGERGGVWIRSGNRFLQVDLLSLGIDIQEDLIDVEVIGGGTELWVAGAAGGLLHRDASGAWTQPPSFTTESVVKIGFPTPTAGFAIGITFTFLEYQ